MTYVPYGTSRTRAQALALLAQKSITVRAPYNLEKPCRLWQGHTTEGGYGRIRCEGADHYIHRLVCDGEVVRHKCDRPNCWEETHLEPGTHADNVADKVAKARHGHGAKHYRAKLTEDDIRAIRNSDEQGTVLSKRFGISRGGIHNIRTGRTWSHIK